ncbi:hypothetical protein PO909_022814 [Leuciscus waleckii]
MSIEVLDNGRNITRIYSIKLDCFQELLLHVFPIYNPCKILKKGKQVWAFKSSIVEPGYPKPLSSFGLPPSVTKVIAAVHDKNSGKTLLFFDIYYYSYNEMLKKMDKGNPKRLADGFPALTGEVTGAHLIDGRCF